MTHTRFLKLAAATGLLAIALIALQGSSGSLAAIDSNNVAALFASKCAPCHAKNGAGLPSWRSKGQPDLTNPDWQKSRTNAQIADVISNGKGKFMPSFKSKLTEEQITTLVGIVRGFGKK